MHPPNVIVYYCVVIASGISNHPRSPNWKSHKKLGFRDSPTLDAHFPIVLKHCVNLARRGEHHLDYLFYLWEIKASPFTKVNSGIHSASDMAGLWSTLLLHVTLVWLSHAMICHEVASKRSDTSVETWQHVFWLKSVIMLPLNLTSSPTGVNDFKVCVCTLGDDGAGLDNKFVPWPLNRSASLDQKFPEWQSTSL